MRKVLERLRGFLLWQSSRKKGINYLLSQVNYIDNKLSIVDTLQRGVQALLFDLSLYQKEAIRFNFLV